MSVVFWAGAAIAAALSGHPVPEVNLGAGVMALAEHRGDPSAAWGRPVGPAWLYWTSTASVFAVVVAVGAACWWAIARNGEARGQDPRRIDGLASKAEVARVAGARALIARAAELRPSLSHPQVGELGHRLGSARGVDCYASVEDSVVLLGPPRSGKGVHVVINAILDAPGTVITTSTRPDNLTAALQARAKVGPVAVFDPQRLAPGIPSSTRWSPIRGCESPQTAMVRAKALTAGDAAGTNDSNFWQSSAEQAVRCLLHAAALGDRTPADLYRLVAVRRSCPRGSDDPGHPPPGGAVLASGARGDRGRRPETAGLRLGHGRHRIRLTGRPQSVGRRVARARRAVRP
ncbi:MAG TPA: type IV secretory system conjugative DNA transfer family protein [Nocardioidaceae bacterium]|nr:type IV secretory system conjugative DNA transfer family protein [Nocardioidaceae bacterium]